MNKKAYLAPDNDIVELKHYLLCHAQQETRHSCGFKGFTVSRFQGFHDLVRKFGKIFLFIYDITYLLFYYILK